MISIFIKGGPIMWPLLLTSLVALSSVCERAIEHIRERRRRKPQDVTEMLRALRISNRDKAFEIGKNSTDRFARCLAFGLQNGGASFGKAFQQQATRELYRLTKGLSILDTIITLAPLLGLLGTVTGMIHAFGLLGASELEAPAAITGGIAEALIATAFGLGIAIISLVPYNWLNAELERNQHELQDLGTQVELLLEEQSAAMSTPTVSSKPFASRA